MAELTAEHLIYLLYTKAYAKDTEADTLTKGDIRSYLPDEHKGKAEKIYGDLKEQGLIELKTKDGKTKDSKGKALTKDGRFSLTGEGNQVLVNNLTTTDYDFTSSRSYKVLSTALTCLLSHIKETGKTHPQTRQTEEITFEEFQDKFKELYFEERKRQELSGAVAIRKKELLKKIQDTNSKNISPEALDKYFEDLKSRGIVFVSRGEKDDLIHWVE